jgi:hypothetical protein
MLVSDDNGLSLALFETRVLLVDDIQAALPADDLAVNTSLLDGGFYFHSTLVYFGSLSVTGIIYIGR